MTASNKIHAEVKKTQVTLAGRLGNTLTFLGSSCPASLYPGEQAESFTVSPGEGEDLVVVKTSVLENRGKYGTWSHGHFLLLISRRTECPWVELEKVFVPEEGRVGQIIPDVGLSVRIGDEFFLSPLLLSQYKKEERLTELKKQYRLVKEADANLLCRFMAGKATAEEVKAAANVLVFETVDVPALRKQLAEAEERVLNLTHDLKEMCWQLERVSQAQLEVRAAHRDLLKNLEGVFSDVDVGWRFWKKPAPDFKWAEIRKLVSEAKANLSEPE